MTTRRARYDAWFERHQAAYLSELLALRALFYREATFFTAPEVEGLLRETGFSIHEWGQTLFRSLPETGAIEPLKVGRGRGAFVVVRATTRG